jgi:hypothetical protein
MLFSVGAGGGLTLGDSARLVVVVGVSVVDGAFEPLPPQPAMDAANPARIAAPATARDRRAAFQISVMTSPIVSVIATSALNDKLHRQMPTARLDGRLSATSTKADVGDIHWCPRQ